MNFKFSAIEANNAKIEALTKQIDDLLADNHRMENLQDKAVAAIAQLNDVFSQLVGGGIDEASMQEFRATVVTTVGAETNSHIAEVRQALNIVTDKLTEETQTKESLEKKVNILTSEKEHLHNEVESLTEELEATRRDAQYYQNALSEHKKDSEVNYKSKIVDLQNIVERLNVEQEHLNSELDFLTKELEETRKDRDHYQSAWDDCKREAIAEKPSVVAEAVVDVPAQAVVDTSAEEAEEIEEVYPLNARPGNVFRTPSYSQVLILATHPKQWLGKVIDTGEIKKFSPADLFSFKYTSSNRTERIKLDKKDPNNFFLVGVEVQSSFSSHVYRVVESNSVETIVDVAGVNTTFLTGDLKKVVPPTQEQPIEAVVELSDREKELIEQAKASLNEELTKPEKKSKRKAKAETVQEASAVPADWREKLKARAEARKQQQEQSIDEVA